MPRARSPTPATPFRSARRASDVGLAPLLCAGLIGWRSLVMARRRRSSALRLRRRRPYHCPGRHWQGRRSSPSPGPAMPRRQDFARRLGAVWAGGSDETPPETLDAAIIFAPVGALVPLGACGGAKGRPRRLRRHPYERHPELSLRSSVGRAALVSVANLTRQDGLDFLRDRGQAGSAPRRRLPARPRQRALADLRDGRLHGAAVLIPPH